MSSEKTTKNFRKNGHTLAGYYYVPYKSELPAVSLILGALAILSIVYSYFCFRYYRNHVDGISTDSMVLASVFIVWIVVEAVMILVFSFLAKKVCGGFKCSYTDDGERFITNEGGNIRSFWYWEVQNIFFTPRTVFGKVRGYDVTIRLVGRDEIYHVTSDGFISKESTPFMIVSDRVDAYNQKKSHDEYIKEINAIGDQVVSSGTQSTSQDRLGMDAEMPAVGVFPKTNPNEPTNSSKI